MIADQHRAHEQFGAERCTPCDEPLPSRLVGLARSMRQPDQCSDLLSVEASKPGQLCNQDPC